MQNQKLIIAAAAAVLITGILAGGITYGVLSARFSKENSGLNKRVAALEKALKNQPAAPAAPSVIRSPMEIEAANYGDWLTYTNADPAFTLRYPTDWTFVVSTEQADGVPIQNVMFQGPESKYYVTFGLRVKGSNALLSGRTGLGQGKLTEDGSVSVLGVTVKKTELIYQDKVKAIFYGGKSAGSLFAAKGYEGIAEFSAIDTSKYDQINLTDLPESITADKIVSSLKITQ